MASEKELREISRLDCHIPAERLAGCIEAGQVYILWDSGTTVGVLRFSLFWQSIPFLDLILLEESARGKGFGRKMMEYWEAAMGRQGFQYVMLSTQADETAQFFYEKLGYRRIGAFLPPEQEADELMYLKALF